MDVFILYDSQYGNTKKIAEAIAAAIGKLHNTIKLLPVEEVDCSDCAVDLLIVGSPTQGGRPTSGLTEFLIDIPKDALNGVKVAAFDTRIAFEDVSPLLRWLMKIIGFAAPKIADSLVKKGGTLIAPPEGFIVSGREGPLKRGEYVRAAEWAVSILGLKQ